MLPTDPYPSRVEAFAEIGKRQEPVLYNPDRISKVLSRQWADDFERNGFGVIENLFEPAEVDLLLKMSVELKRRHGHRDLQAGTVIAEPGEGNDKVRSVFAIHQQSDAFELLVRDQRLLDISQALLDDDVYIHQSRLNYKPAFHGKEFYWHSDFETWHSEDGMPRMRAISISVMLTDNHAQAGPTMFIPGSHKCFVACMGKTPDNHHASSLRKQEYGVPDHDSLRDLVRERGLAAPVPSAGSVVVFDCNTLHGSNGNITPFERTNAFLVYNAWSNRLVEPYGMTQPRPEYIAHRKTSQPLSTTARNPK